MNSTVAGGLLTVAILGLSAGMAQAHPRLLTAKPAVDAHLAAPTEIRLGFSETLIGRFSQVSLTDAGGHMVRTGPSALSADHKQLVAPIRARLSPGAYKVSWRAVSTDTHRVSGGYAFTVVR